MTVTYKENGSIEIDNSELLKNRADVTMDNQEGERYSEDVDTSKARVSGGLGNLPHGKEEEKIRHDKIRTGWHEPSHKATDVKHVCPVCGTRYWGRPNKHYCGTPCKEIAKKRRQRKRKRDIRDFKPSRGKAGEVYFITEKDVITFIPAFYADTRARAKKYLEDTYEDTEQVNDYYEQVSEVIRK